MTSFLLVFSVTGDVCLCIVVVVVIRHLSGSFVQLCVYLETKKAFPWFLICYQCLGLGI